jgi:putative peptidoglycan lipid II flippase
MSAARERLTRSAGVVAAAVMTSRLLGLAREVILAHFFAPGLALDAFNAAFRIPNMLRDLFGEGALSKAFVTTFTETEVKRGEAETWRLASRVLNLLLVVVGGLTILGIVFAPALVAVMLPGEGFDTPLPPAESYGFATKRDLTVFLTRVMFPFLPLVSLAAVAMGVLNSKRRFGLPALSSAFFNVASIAVGVVGYVVGPRYGFHPVVGMAAGVLAGGLLQWLVQVPQMRAVGYRWTPELSLSDPGVRRIGRLIGPATIGVAAVQINVFVNTVLASNGSGWLSWINVAFRLMYLPIGVFGVAISTANLPALARHAAENDMTGFRETLSHALRLMLLLTIPSSVGLAVLSRPIISLIYEHGAFTAHDAEMAGGALFYYALGLTGYSAVKVVTDAFYALSDTLTPLKVSAAAIALNIALGCTLVYGLGWDHRGLALSTSVSVMANFVAALGVLRLRVGRIGGRAVARMAAKTLVASALMGVAVRFVAASVGPDRRALQVALSVLTGVLVFALAALLLRIREIREIRG